MFIATRNARGDAKVIKRIGVKDLKIVPRYDLRNHSPTGFEWGYGGSGPAQLALAILSDVLKPHDDLTQRLYQDFKSDVIAGLPKEGWTLTEAEVLRWVHSQSKACTYPLCRCITTTEEGPAECKLGRRF